MILIVVVIPIIPLSCECICQCPDRTHTTGGQSDLRRRQSGHAQRPKGKRGTLKRPVTDTRLLDENLYVVFLQCSAVSRSCCRVNMSRRLSSFDCTFKTVQLLLLLLVIEEFRGIMGITRVRRLRTFLLIFFSHMFLEVNYAK